MYILTWYTEGKGVSEVTGEIKSILELANMLENSKTQFSISNRLGKLNQEQFDLHGYKFWAKKDDSFTGR